MPRSAPRSGMNSPTLIYDGDCGFCTSSAHWIAARWTGSSLAVAWQQLGPEGLASAGLTESDVRRAAYWVDARGGVFRGHAAVAKSLLEAGGALRLVGRLLLTPPVSWLARPGYWVVARSRHRLPGATDACRL
ncbi:MAG: thiol-disulfide oxidoreductase DCC family protein [Acidimicrobiales bacterium]